MAATTTAQSVPRVFLLVFGIWMALCGGTLYMFSAFEVELMAACSLSARKLDNVYAAGQLGVGLAIVAGALHDRYGPGVTLVYACALITTGSLGMDAFLKIDGCAGVHALAVSYMLLQNGSSALYQMALFSNIRAALPAWQGTTTGIISAGYGLSAALFAAAFVHVFGRDLGRYFRGTAALFGFTAFAAVVIVPRLLQLSVSASPCRSYNSLEEEGEADSGAPSQGKGMAATSTTVEPVPTTVGCGDSDDKSGRPATQCAPQAADTPLSSVFKAADFWLFVATFAQLQAVGSGMFIANLSLIAQSLDIPEGNRLQYVAVVSYCNCIGRFFAGLLIDKLEPLGVPRCAHAIWTATILVFVAASLCLAPGAWMPDMLFPAFLAVGFAYGANWAVMPSYCAWRFGGAHVGVCFNLNAAMMSLAVVGASSAVGSLYDSAAMAMADSHPSFTKEEAGAGAEFCSGPQCWRPSFTLGLCLSCTGLATALVLTGCTLRAART